MNSYTKSPNVSVVIPTRNGGDLFHQVLEKLKTQDYSGKVEIIVIDSSSSDNTLEIARKFSDKVETISPEEFNHGLTRNYGIQIATGEIIVLMTQDAVPANNKLIHYLVAAFDDPDVAGVYAKQLPRPEADVLTKRNLENWLTGRSESDLQQIPDKLTYQQLSPFERYMLCNFDNVCSAVRKSVWKDIPFIKNDFGEDIEWSLRTLTSGWKIAYQSQAVVVHSHDRSPIYEYKRTYMCHRKLYELFELQCIPSLKYVRRSLIYATLTDWRYVLLHEPNLVKKLKLMIRIPALSIASVWGQYRGAKDEELQKGKKLIGV